MVTSPTGAAVRDILRVLRRRNAGMDVVILPTPVQGEGADERIASAIETAGRWKLGEVIIVGRGGGSLEDLLPFSSEVVVRAIAASPVPVISAVGHETDVTLSDLAADIRAPTPSAAAEMVAASSTELLAQVAGLQSVLQGALQGQRLERIRLLLGQFTPENLERNIRLLLQPSLQRLDDAREGVNLGFQGRLAEARHRFELASREIASYSPLAVLQRGYAVVTHGKSRTVLLSAQGVKPGMGWTSGSRWAECGQPWRKRMPTKSFEERLERLEKLAEKLREGKIPLEEAVTLFEEGMKLARSLEKDLARVERKVEILTREPGAEDERAGA